MSSKNKFIRDGSVVEAQLEPHLRNRISSGGALTILLSQNDDGSNQEEDAFERAITNISTNILVDVCANESCRDVPLVLDNAVLAHSRAIVSSTQPFEYYDDASAMRLFGYMAVALDALTCRGNLVLDVVVQTRDDAQSDWTDFRTGARRVYYPSTSSEFLLLEFDDSHGAQTHVRFVLRIAHLSTEDETLTITSAIASVETA